MPRRPLLALAALTAVLIFIYLLAPAESTLRWRSHVVAHPTSAKDDAADREPLTALKLDGPVEYRRRCITVRPTKGLHRSLLAKIASPMFEVPATQGLTREDALPPCQQTVRIDVPYSDPRAKVHTSELFLGMATKLKRIDDSLPALSRWLAHTGSPLLVLLVDKLDLVAKADDIEAVSVKAETMGMEIIFEPYKGKLSDTEGLKNFALASALHSNIRPTTRWFGVIDDDTFFLSLPPTLKALRAYDHTREFYIGALTEGHFRIAQEGFKAWGGAGFFISPPLMHNLAANSERCRALDQGFGDLLWRDCILEVTSPTVKLTQLEGLNQMDLWGDISGWYESPHPKLLTVHHWKSWHYHDIPLASTVADVAGWDSFLQRHLFSDNTVLTNGYSVTTYPAGLPDLNKTELTFAEDVGVKEKPGRLMFHHSLGVTRPELMLGSEKIQWVFRHAVYGSDGSVRQFYVKKEGVGGEGSVDSVIEIDWRRG